MPYGLPVMRIILIVGFGAAGTLARYALQGWAQRLSASTFPYGTLAVNVLGSFLAGLVAALAIERAMVSPMWRAAILVGFCGGFTTYSAFAYETFDLLKAGDPMRGAANVAAQLALGIGAVWLGWWVATKV